MTFALISTNPRAVLEVYPGLPPRLDLPSGRQVFGASAGWTDGGYSLVAVAPFVPPVGQSPVGAPSYSFDGNGNVVQTFATQPTPLNVIPFAVFISRWTNAEYVALMQARANAIANNTAGIGLVRQWDMSLAVGTVDLNAAAAQNFKAALVTAAILTQARADVIFA